VNPIKRILELFSKVIQTNSVEPTESLTEESRKWIEELEREERVESLDQALDAEWREIG
jgi:hypothetical protein